MGIPTKEEVQERERLAKSGLKRCSVRAGCGEIKPVDEFGPSKRGWDNKRSICILCNRENSKKHYLDNREAKSAYARQRYLNNREAWLEYCREYKVKKRQEDPMFARLEMGKARAKKAGAEFEAISSTDLLSHWEQNNISISTCHYCQETIDEDELEFDHGTPIGRGGGHTIDNLFPSHKRCNRQKKDRTVEEYNQYLMQAV